MVPEKLNKTEIELFDKQQWSRMRRRYNLTPREVEVAELLCRGLTSSEVASEVRITSGTVKTHIRNIYRKMQVNSKIAMLLRFLAETGATGGELDGRGL